jgi:hypothetical protein
MKAVVLSGRVLLCLSLIFIASCVYADDFSASNSAVEQSIYSEGVRNQNLNAQQRAYNAQLALPPPSWSIQSNDYASSVSRNIDIEAQQQAYNAQLALPPPSWSIQSNDYASSVSRNIGIEAQQAAQNSALLIPPASLAVQSDDNISSASRNLELDAQQRAQYTNASAAPVAWSQYPADNISSASRNLEIEAQQQAYNAALLQEPPSRAIESGYRIPNSPKEIYQAPKQPINKVDPVGNHSVTTSSPEAYYKFKSAGNELDIPSRDKKEDFDNYPRWRDIGARQEQMDD